MLDVGQRVAIEPQVSAYSLDATEIIGCVISVERTKADGTAWAVRCDGMCLKVGVGGWDYEPMPSSRTDEFLASYRFGSAEQAIKAAQEAIAEWAKQIHGSEPREAGTSA